MSQSRTLDIQGQTVHCVIEGEGPALLLLHGWPTHSGLYRHALPAIGDQRRAIAIDLPGFGHSSKPTDVRYSFSFFNKIIDGVLEQVGVDDVGLVVHDIGGPVGLHWAVENQSRVRELVILNTTAFSEMHWMVKLFVAAVSLPVVSRALTSSYGIRGSMNFGTKTKLSDDVLDIYSTPFKTGADRLALAMTGRHLSLPKIARTAEKLKALDVPTLLLYGTEDRILPDVAHTMSRLETMWPHATKTALPGVGHFLQEDAPDLVAQHIVQFLSRET